MGTTVTPTPTDVGLNPDNKGIIQASFKGDWGKLWNDPVRETVVPAKIQIGHLLNASQMSWHINLSAQF